MDRLLAMALLTLLVALAGSVAGHKDDKTGPKSKGANLLVRLPPGARLRIDGKEVTPGAGPATAERTVTTAPVPAGKRRAFSVQAVWAPNGWTTVTRTRRVSAAAGEAVTVDLRRPSADQPDEYFIRYVTTPPNVVAAMLDLAKVGKDDVVFDLGCGDGRMVVTALAKYGARRGVGVDIDPERIKDARRTAKEAGVTDRIEFAQCDARRVKGLEKATVVCIYLGEELNAQLRPVLEKALRPGARVVSHRFPIAGWEPDEVRTVSAGGAARKVYLWTVKAPRKAGEKKR